MMKSVSFLAALAFAVVGWGSAIAACQYETGEARWGIKTSVPGDPNVAPTHVSLQSLIQLSDPVIEAGSINVTRWPGDVALQDDSGQAMTLHEGDIVTVTGYHYRARCQKDGDYHMEIGVSPTHQDADCIIVEVPDPSQIGDPTLQALVSRSRNELEGMRPSPMLSHPSTDPPQVTVTGQLFIDETHNRSGDPGGGRGTLLDSGRHCASNLWEIHPVIRIE
jgi:hypothetical protein